MSTKFVSKEITRRLDNRMFWEKLEDAFEQFNDNDPYHLISGSIISVAITSFLMWSGVLQSTTY